MYKKSTNRHLISIILPCLNAGKTLAPCLDSLLSQAYPHFEIIAIDDGSTDGTLEILERFAKKDYRIKILGNDTNQGISLSLNKGIGLAKGAYIARMDADDIAQPQRLEEQVHYLLLHPEVDVLGTGVSLISENDKIVLPNHFICTQPAAIYFASFFTAPLFHPTIMGKSEVLKKHPYSDAPEHKHIEDFELWHRLAALGYCLANLPKVLLHYRYHPFGVSQQKSEIQTANATKYCQQIIAKELGIHISDQGIQGLRHSAPGKVSISKEVFQKLVFAFNAQVELPSKAYQEVNKFVELSLMELSIKNIGNRFSAYHLFEMIGLLYEFGFLLPYLLNRIFGYIRRQIGLS